MRARGYEGKGIGEEGVFHWVVHKLIYISYQIFARTRGKSILAHNDSNLSALVFEQKMILIVQLQEKVDHLQRKCAEKDITISALSSLLKRRTIVPGNTPRALSLVTIKIDKTNNLIPDT